MTPTVSIACAHDHITPGRRGEAIVAVDVIRATTTAVTAVSAGRRVFVAGSMEEVSPLSERLPAPLLAGELGGSMPFGFELHNSPAAVAGLPPGPRPLVLLSTSGTRLMAEAAAAGDAYAACLRNTTAQVRHSAAREDDVRLLGAGSRREFRPEDQLCCARIARGLVERGHEIADRATEDVLTRWWDAPDEAILDSPSARYLRGAGHERDLAFVLEHVDDLDRVFPVISGEVRMREPAWTGR